MDFSLSLALYDFVPVLLTGIALFYVWQMSRHFAPQQRSLAAVGATLVVAAGLSKASWKLIVASTGTDLVLLSQLLFPLMAPGFVLMAFVVWAIVRRANEQSVPPWLWVLPILVITAAFLVADYRMFIAQIERGWFQPLLVLVSIGNVAMIAFFISASVRRRRWGLAGLFLLNIGMTFALQPIAAMDNLSITMHWVEQTLTAVGAGAFALAAYRLDRVLRGVPDPQPLRPEEDRAFAETV